MAKLVKQIHDLIGLAIDKGYTQYISDADIDNAIDQGQMVLFRQLVKEFPRNKRVRNDLLPFEVKASIVITAKVGAIPSDFEHEIDAWVTVSSVDYPVKFVESGFFKRRILDVVDPPSTTNIFACIYNDGGRKVEVAPQATPLILTYFKRPTKPVYGTTGPTNGQFIYSDGASTDVDWKDSVHDLIVQNTLAILGLNLRDGQVQRAGQAEMPKSATL